MQMKHTRMRWTIKIIFVFLGLTIGLAPAKAQELTVSFTTTSISGAEYSPNHILAVWVKNSAGTYQRTLMVYAKDRKGYLYKWQGSSGGDKTDAVTGATLTSHQTHSVTWNLKNIAGQTLPQGSYLLCMEMTSMDGQGPYREISFTVGSDSYTLTPADGNNFKNISIAYKSSGTSVDEPTLNHADDLLKIVTDPLTGGITALISLEKDSETTIELFDVSQKKLSSTKRKLNEGLNRIDLSSETASLAPGVYFILVETDHYTLGKKFIR